MKAGFDLSEISVENWKSLLKTYDIDENAVKTPKGWVWNARYTNAYNFIVTANNPITGVYYHDRRQALKRTKWQDKNHIKHNRYDSAPHYLHTPYIQGKSRKVRNPFELYAKTLRDIKNGI